MLTLPILLCFLVTGVMGPNPLCAQEFRLPAPGVMVHLSTEFNPPILKGIKIHSENPFKFDFILDKGDSQLSNAGLKDESRKLIKYFLASLTIPEKDLWVNLSPYEKNRIIPNSFGLTEMGRDLLVEDYMLKQITASLIYPKGEIGKKFWKRIYKDAEKKFGTTNVSVNTFNKVWIVPEKAVVYENNKVGAAYVVESRLKVMLEQDYLSLQKHEGISNETKTQAKETSQLGSQIVREIVIPELTKEVNENKNFAQLRQVYNSLILATWYKNKIKDSILEQVYADKNKVVGVNVDDPKEMQRIYQRYLQAFKKGVYNFIKEDTGPDTKKTAPRKYFSGGFGFGRIDKAMSITTNYNQLVDTVKPNNRAMIVSATIDMAMSEAADVSFNPLEALVKEPQLRALFERIYTQHYVVRSVPKGKEIVRNVLNTLTRNWQNQKIAAQQVYDHYDFKNSVEWKAAEVNFVSLIRDLSFQISYPEILAQLHSGAVVFDLGTGQGVVAQFVASHRPDITVKGADIDPQYQDKFNMPNLQFLLMPNPNKIPLADNSVDLVIVNFVLHHLESSILHNLLKEIHRISRPGAKVFIREPTFSMEKDINNPRTNIEVSKDFQNAVRQYGAELGRAYLAFSEWYSVVLGRRYNWPMPYNFHSMEEWETIMASHGMKQISADFYAFQKAPDSNSLISTQPRGDMLFTVEKTNGLQKSPPSDNAQTGGIDLTPANKILQTQNGGVGIKFHVDQAQLAQWQKVPGVIIESITIQPLVSLSAFLGLADSHSLPGK